MDVATREYRESWRQNVRFFAVLLLGLFVVIFGLYAVGAVVRTVAANPSAVRCVYPWPLLAGRFVEDAFVPSGFASLVSLADSVVRTGAILQAPAYALALAYGWRRRRFAAAALVTALVHVVGVLLCYWLVSEVIPIGRGFLSC